jgi:hypothetical protein
MQCLVVYTTDDMQAIENLSTLLKQWELDGWNDEQLEKEGAWDHD